MERFFAEIGSLSSEDSRNSIGAVARRHGLGLHYANTVCRIYADEGVAHPFPDGAGLLVGQIFPRDPLACGKSIDPVALSHSNGAELIEHYWGRYIAFVAGRDGEAVHVLRDPTGSIPCYQVRAGALTLLASDTAPLLEASAHQLAVDWEFVRQLVIFPHLRGRRTGLVGIDELVPGSRWTFGRGETHETCCWTPWRYTRKECRIDDFDIASSLLRETIVRAVRSLAGSCRRPLLELSGGLDSSILAAALTVAGIHATCVNLTTSDAESDERRYARLVTERTGLPLVERTSHDVAAIDVSKPSRHHIERPGAQAWLQAWEAPLIEVAKARACDAFLSGTGGDNVFCLLSSAAPAADLIRTGHWANATRATMDLATIHSASFWHVLRFACRMASRTMPTSVWPFDKSFAACRIGEPDTHPWLAMPSRTLPGSRAHMRSIFATVAHQGGSNRDTYAPSLYPLLAQPVQELCLAIPSWFWVRGGHDRAVARAAFADLLPPEIIHRRTKGAVDSFCFRVFERNRALIRDMLIGGHLSHQGLLDRTALTVWFDAPVRSRDAGYFRILSLVDIEIWLRDWLGPA